MNRDQAVHVGMINSFNLITEKATLEQIVSSGIGVFAHLPEDDIDADNIKFIIYYFQEHEMFEHCAELKEYLEKHYNNDGTPKVQDCECDYPAIVEYTIKMVCGNCNKRLRR
jgi:hypothetical protein